MRMRDGDGEWLHGVIVTVQVRQAPPGIHEGAEVLKARQRGVCWGASALSKGAMGSISAMRTNPFLALALRRFPGLAWSAWWTITALMPILFPSRIRNFTKIASG